ELDYQFVMDCLKDYSSARAKLGRLLHEQALIRVKKGLYLLGPQFQHHPYCLELVANLIYGPSYVSLERALYIYGMIPEHVEAITSVTSKASCSYRTPVGNFMYAHCHPKSYSVGITTRSYGENENPFIATREKALTDMLTIRRGKITSEKHLQEILLEDLRIEEEDLLELDLERIQEIYQAYPHSAVYFLQKWLTQFKAKQ
ncbi:MAG: hypothetical protein JSR46_08855, partial [Verrucomicrobia bacterium]|nr:hypothetical protein [Verrucomicrobiota bacterium]